MNQVLLEIVAAVVAAIVTPLLVGVTTIGFTFSKTYINTFIQTPYDFNNTLIKKFIRSTYKMYAPVTFLWGGTLAILSPLTTNTTETITVYVLGGIIATLLITGVVLTRYPHIIRQYLSTETSFYPESLTHRVILHSLIWVQLLFVLGCFFGVITLIQL